ncbi:MAG TPA: hypothetical protein VFD85_15085 [Gemmatimonadales bacterium]|nr:hypothetical protein [Gemmatimonadales bacterium]
MSNSREYDTPPAVVFTVGLLGIALGAWLLAIHVLTLFALLFIMAGGGAILLWFRRGGQGHPADHQSAKAATVDAARGLRSAQRMIVAAHVLCLVALLWIFRGVWSSHFAGGTEGRLEGVVRTLPVVFLALILDVGGTILAFRALARSPELRTARNRLLAWVGIPASPFLAWYVWHFAIGWLFWMTGLE